MIVVDKNVIAYFVIPGDISEFGCERPDRGLQFDHIRTIPLTSG
jgi:hypothetical protein